MTAQIAALDLQANKPLLVFDADEVLVHFALPFSHWLKQQDWHLQLHDYNLLHAIKSANGQAADPAQMRILIDGFIDSQTRHQPATAGAAQCLAHLANHAQILILTNVPHHRKAERMLNLAEHAMPYPVIANHGPKGPALAHLARLTRAPIAFVDDNPDQIASAAEHAPQIHRVHFTGCDFVRGVLPFAPTANAHPKTWVELSLEMSNFLA